MNQLNVKLISTINIEELMSPIVVLAHLIMVASLRKYQITGENNSDFFNNGLAWLRQAALSKEVERLALAITKVEYSG